MEGFHQDMTHQNHGLPLKCVGLLCCRIRNACRDIADVSQRIKLGLSHEIVQKIPDDIRSRNNLQWVVQDAEITRISESSRRIDPDIPGHDVTNFHGLIFTKGTMCKAVTYSLSVRVDGILYQCQTDFFGGVIRQTRSNVAKDE